MGFNDNLFSISGSNFAGRLGSDKQVGDATALFLKKFAGEVLTVFDQKNIMKPLHTIRTITKGKSAQFPVIGTAASGYYSPGSDILAVAPNADGSLGGLNAIKNSERMIHIDKVLMSSTFIASIDELVSHFDVRSPYSHQLGEALANRFDKNVLKVAVKTGAKDGTDGVDANGLVPADAFISGVTTQGSVVYSQTAAGTVSDYDGANTSGAGAAVGKLRDDPTASYLRKALFESARLLDEKDVPQSDRYCILTPKMYYELINNSENTDVVNSIINKDVGGAGSVSAGTLGQVAGITILTSNHLPSAADVSTDNQWASQSPANDYTLKYQDCAGIVFQKGGFATLKLMDLTMESEYMIARQGNLFVAKYSMGHGSLRPESVVVWSDSRQRGAAS